jgi:hypothetical protein
MIAQFVRRRGLDHVIAIAICALMLFFAVGSKVAWYHSKGLAARSIAATKVWKAKSVAVDPEPTDVSVPFQAAVELIVLFSLFLVLAEPTLEREDAVFPLPVENFPALAMRPPPVR